MHLRKFVKFYLANLVFCRFLKRLPSRKKKREFICNGFAKFTLSNPNLTYIIEIKLCIAACMPARGVEPPIGRCLHTIHPRTYVRTHQRRDDDPFIHSQMQMLSVIAHMHMIAESPIPFRSCNAARTCRPEGVNTYVLPTCHRSGARIDMDRHQSKVEAAAGHHNRISVDRPGQTDGFRQLLLPAAE